MNGRDYGVYVALGKTFQFDTIGAFVDFRASSERATHGLRVVNCSLGTAQP